MSSLRNTTFQLAMKNEMDYDNAIKAAEKARYDANNRIATEVFDALWALDIKEIVVPERFINNSSIFLFLEREEFGLAEGELVKSLVEVSGQRIVGWGDKQGRMSFLYYKYPTNPNYRYFESFDNQCIFNTLTDQQQLDPTFSSLFKRALVSTKEMFELIELLRVNGNKETEQLIDQFWN